MGREESGVGAVGGERSGRKSERRVDWENR